MSVIIPGLVNGCSMETARTKLTRDIDLTGLERDLAGFDLSGITLMYLDLAGFRFTRSQLSQGCFDGAILTGSDFTRSCLVGTSFRNIDGNNGTFKLANISGCDFSGSSLIGTNFWGCDISPDSRFYNSNLSDAIFFTAKVSRELFNDASVLERTQIPRPTNPDVAKWFEDKGAILTRF